MARRVSYLGARIGVFGALSLASMALASASADVSFSVPARTSRVPAWAAKGSIAFKCGDSLCLIRPSGTGRRQLLRSGRPWPQWDPAFSPNGRRIAFRGYYGPGDGEYALYVVGVDGCHRRRLTRSIAGNPSWSPDGKWIVFDTSGYGVIFKVHPDGSGLTRVVASKGSNYDASPAWSPTGRTIAFVRYHRGRGQLWLARSDGSKPTLLHADARASDELPVWSHAGTRIAFVARAGRHGVIEVVDASGHKLHPLSTAGNNASNPAWLPHDAGIAYLAPRSDTGGVFVIRTNGTAAQGLPLPRTGQFAWTGTPLPQHC